MAVIESLESRSLFASLSAGDVSTILAAAASQAHNKQAVVVSDREGVILGVFAVGKATTLTLAKAAVRARTAAFFQSAENAFTTRTARFIIQDNFPFPVPNTEGGPLYGVQFSSLPGSDVYSGPAISGDPGGIPLYKNGEPVGGIGVAGDGHDVAFRADALDQPNASVDNANLESFTGKEESDFDEAVALAGAASYSVPDSIRADRTLINGLRFSFTKDSAATGQAARSLTQLIAAGVGALKKLAGFKSSSAIRASVAAPYPAATFGGVAGELKNTNAAATNFGFVSGNDTDASGINLTVADVKRVITRAVQQATTTRAGIRLPIGTSAKVHVAVVDRDGDLLGVFRMGDGTNFSYDVAVSKARTAAFFSDNTHAFTARAIGFLSQRYFPPGITQSRTGPLFGLQNALSNLALFKGTTNNPLKNGVTIFPGGVPLYKNGVFVGAVGVSGDGVDQDDLIATAGTTGYRAPLAIRSDFLSNTQVVAHLRNRLDEIADDFAVPSRLIDRLMNRLKAGLNGVKLPYVKFPRNPDV